jgi:hypothetical protein
MKEASAARDERLARARALVEAGAYLITGDAVLVYSDQPGVPGWTVERGGVCRCPDATVGYAYRFGLPCKHRLAAEIALSETTEESK